MVFVFQSGCDFIVLFLEARGEIQNFMQNFLENPRHVQTQQKQATAEQFEMEVKEEQEPH